MLNISFPACAQVELYDLIACIMVNGESHRYLNLGPTMPIMEFVHILILYNLFQFHVPRSITF